MKTVLPVIRILVVIQIIQNVCCQNGYSEQDLMRYQQMVNEGAETINSYNTNMQRDPNSQSLSSINTQYHMSDDNDKNEDYNRSDRPGRSRKVFRIKNPFQRQLDGNEQQNTETDTQQDNATGASNQYTAMQYSLPPEDFLQRMRAESQFYQQPVTQAPALSYTTTPQPQPQPQPYQYSTIMASEYNPNQPTNSITELDPKLSHPQQYQNNQNYQYNVQSSYNLNGIQSTTPSPYLSTPMPNNYVITPNNPYVSSSSPMLMSNSPNTQQYVSSPLSILNGSPDFGNRVTSTISNNVFENSDSIKKMQIDHYDNSANGIRYPNSIQQQLSNDYPTSTAMPTSSPYSEPWQNNNVNSLSKSLHELSFSQFSNNNGYSNNQQDSRNDQNIDSDTHRVGNMPAANNLYLNYVQPDYQVLNQMKIRTRDTEQETGQPEVYSHGDYGWKLYGKKPSLNDNYNSASQQQQRYQGFNLPSDGGAVSQMNFHMDTGKQNKYEQISKSSADNLDAQEFAKAAAKAQQQQQLQQSQQNYNNNYGTSYNPYVSSSDKYFGNIDKQRNRAFSDNSNQNSFYGNSQELVTASPYLYNSQNYDTKSRQPFDHAKALKNIVPIVDSNGGSESQSPSSASIENFNRFNHYKEQMEQSLKQFYKPLTDAYYKDKNTIYGFNIQTKPEQSSESPYKQNDANLPFYAKQQNHDSLYNHNSFNDNKRFSESPSSSLNYPSSYHSDNSQASANIQQQSMPRNQNQPTDIASILKFNDMPYRLPQGLSQDSLKLQNDDQNIPTPLPLRFNQNVASHQLDVASNILNKLMANNKQGQNRPDIDFSNGSPISTINGFKVANPFNVDLKLVSDMLKGKPAIDDSQLWSIRDQFNKPSNLKVDLSQIQQLLLKNDNNVNLASSLNDGLGGINSPYFDLFSTGRYPYQGVKYSRSQEEEEPLIPIADASITHPIGAVVDQDPVSEREVSTDTELTAQEDEPISHNFDEDRPKSTFVSGHRTVGDRHRHPNTLAPGRRRPYQRKYPKTNIDEPYPLLKPPPPKRFRNKGPRLSLEQRARRQRANKQKVLRILNTEPLFEAQNDENEEPSVPTLLQPPPQVAEAKSDKNTESENS